MIGLIAGGLAAAAKTGYSLYSKNRSEAERRQYLDYSLARQYGYHLKSLRESPTAQREGLVAAGYNPMLALGNLSSSFSGSGSMPPPLSDSVPDVIGSASAWQSLKQQKAETKKSEAEAELAEDVSLTQRVKNKLERMLDGAKLDALENDEYVDPHSAKSITVGMTKMQQILAKAFADEMHLDAKHKGMMNSDEGLRALITEKMGKQAVSPVGRAIYDLMGDWLLRKEMKEGKNNPPIRKQPFSKEYKRADDLPFDAETRQWLDVLRKSLHLF